MLVNLKSTVLLGDINVGPGVVDVSEFDASRLRASNLLSDEPVEKPLMVDPAPEDTGAAPSSPITGGRFSRRPVVTEQPTSESTAPASDLDQLALDADVISLVTKAGIATIAQLQATDVNAIPGVGKAIAGKIKNALDVYAAEHPAS